MKITFLGTRGNIDVKNRRHKRHAVTLISYKGTCVAIDWGFDWRSKINKINSDLISITQRHKALSGVQLYIGDGASITRPIIRHKNDKLFGHTTIRAQLDWCQKEKVPRAIFTHCGSQIVEGDERMLGPLVKELGKQREVDAKIAYDGLNVILRSH